MTSEEGTFGGSNPTPEAGRTVLQRGAFGRWALVDGHGACIEADAEVFVEIKQ